jgi:MFS family permease
LKTELKVYQFNGAIASGKIVDCIGKKGALIVAAVPSIVGWLAISLEKKASLLYVGRLLTGFAMGSISLTVPVYIAETALKHLRRALGTVNKLSITIGIGFLLL